jgi:archaellum component FlaC
MEDILIILDKIDKRLELLEDKINKIESYQSNIYNNTYKMEQHINFVEDIYDKVKKPLVYATNKINSYISGPQININELEQK